jgi:hypothetical protein
MVRLHASIEGSRTTTEAGPVSGHPSDPSVALGVEMFWCYNSRIIGPGVR